MHCRNNAARGVGATFRRKIRSIKQRGVHHNYDGRINKDRWLTSDRVKASTRRRVTASKQSVARNKTQLWRRSLTRASSPLFEIKIKPRLASSLTSRPRLIGNEPGPLACCLADNSARAKAPTPVNFHASFASSATGTVTGVGSFYR